MDEPDIGVRLQEWRCHNKQERNYFYIDKGAMVVFSNQHGK